jgi:hypothetical protein
MIEPRRLSLQLAVRSLPTNTFLKTSEKNFKKSFTKIRK